MRSRCQFRAERCRPKHKFGDGPDLAAKPGRGQRLGTVDADELRRDLYEDSLAGRGHLAPIEKDGSAQSRHDNGDRSIAGRGPLASCSGDPMMGAQVPLADSQQRPALGPACVRREVTPSNWNSRTVTPKMSTSSPPPARRVGWRRQCPSHSTCDCVGVPPRLLKSVSFASSRPRWPALRRFRRDGRSSMASPASLNPKASRQLDVDLVRIDQVDLAFRHLARPSLNLDGPQHIGL